MFKLPQTFLRFGVEFEINSQQADRQEDTHTNVFMFEDCVYAYVKGMVDHESKIFPVA